MKKNSIQEMLTNEWHQEAAGEKLRDEIVLLLSMLAWTKHHHNITGGEAGTELRGREVKITKIVPTKMFNRERLSGWNFQQECSQ